TAMQAPSRSIPIPAYEHGGFWSRPGTSWQFAPPTLISTQLFARRTRMVAQTVDPETQPATGGDAQTSPQRSIQRMGTISAPLGETLGDFLAALARRYGERPALAVKPGFRTQLITYAELDRTARRVGRMLQQRGVHAGDRVLLCAPNMPLWVAA